MGTLCRFCRRDLKTYKLTSMQLMQANPVNSFGDTLHYYHNHASQSSSHNKNTFGPRSQNREVDCSPFFLANTPGGRNASAVKVIQTNGTTNGTSRTPFGTIWVVDDPLTMGPEPTSMVIGNSRGVYVSAGQNEFMLVAYLDFGFTSGEFNGSSISMFSRNRVAEIEREFAEVGGQGKFRMATGFAKPKCIFYKESNADSIVEYTVAVRHY